MTREQIRQAADIVRETTSALDYATLIGIHVGKNGFAQCPFHSGDRTGSLKLYEGRRGWHCFGCGASGDVLELAKRFYNLSFPQAIAKVAQDAGIPLPGLTMTYEQGLEHQKKIHAAQQHREELEHDQEKAAKIEERYLDAFGDMIEIERQYKDLDEQISQMLANGEEPDDTLMDTFFATYAALLTVKAVVEDLEIRRIFK